MRPFFRKKDPADNNPQQVPAIPAVHQAEAQASSTVEPEAAAAEESRPFLASVVKTHLDKKSMDLVVAVEQIIQERQHAEQHIYELQDRLTHSNVNIERLTRDIRNLNRLIEERDKSISELETQITGKNLKIDQVMEDYRELQAALNAEIEELKSAVDLERQKYGSMVQKHNEALAEKNKRIGELEEKIGKLEIENSHIKQKYESQRQEKAYLVNMINDFTNRMASPFAPDKSERNEGNGER